MQKNSITNKITPCCSLPFSVVYWWVSNLTLNSEGDRQFIISKISQNGSISIEAWKVLANSASLEADASFNKTTLLTWFDCGNQPSCERLKLIIEGLKIGNWTPETELPANIATIDKTVNGTVYTGNTYTKEQTSALLTSAYKGIATTTTVPTPTGAFWYTATTAGTYTNFKDAGNASIVVSAADLDVVNGVSNNRVILEINNNVATKRIERIKGDMGATADPAKLPLYSAIKSANILTGTQFIDDERGGIAYRVKSGQTLLTTEIPANVVGVKVEIIGATTPTLSIISFPASMPMPTGYFKVRDLTNGLIQIQQKDPAFILKIKTDNAGTSGANQFTFVGVGTYNIDWDDGVKETKTGTATHTFPAPGTYNIKVTGGLNYIRYANASDKLKLLEIINWGSIAWTSFQDAFYGCANLILSAIDTPNLSGVSVMQRIIMDGTAFKGHESMKRWDVSTITNAQNAFNNSGMETDVTNWRFSRNLTLINNFWFKTKIGLGGVPDSDVYNMWVINLANWAYETGTPLNVNAGGNGKYYTSKKYTVIGQFNNAIDAMAYLTGTLNWTWAESSYARTVLQDGQFDKGYMVLGVDDGYSSWNSLFLPLLTAKNKKATFFVAGVYMDGATNPAHSTWTLVKALYNAGHNIECHTWDHTDLAVMGEKKTIDMVDKIDQQLLANGMQKSLHISYPFGSHSDNTKKWLRNDTFLKTGRKTRINIPGVNPEFDGLITTHVDKFAIPCEPFTGTMTSGNLERFKMLLDQAKAEKKALVVYAHEFTTDDTKVVDANWITIALAGAIFDYCDSIGVEVITHDKLYTLLDASV